MLRVFFVCAIGRQSGLHARPAEAAGLGLGEAQASLRTMMGVAQLGMPMVYGQLYQPTRATHTQSCLGLDAYRYIAIHVIPRMTFGAKD